MIFNYVKRNATPSLTEEHKHVRLNFALEHLNKPPAWTMVICSDEIKFNLDGPDGLQHYWRDLRHEHETYLSRKFGGKSVMVWGAFSSAGLSELAFLEGNQNADKYIWTLQDYLFPFAHDAYSDDILFQQDTASIHRAKATMEFLREQKVTVFAHPVLFPDLNPIENLWGIVVREVYKDKTAINLAWAKIDPVTIQNLVESMPRRCTGVVVAMNGGMTKY
ncbi:hypothetical protein AaE_007770 [Aphanomyces astaci]|uniref:Tc1-like transposase DDE domain-containing protein n=1 Tax=Aphanomyces astaci TaxID=112090 RepID=A0A6A5ADM1_APHAT|nr:hypothetical protein AaE_007770 [Aphanomyces astaci]